VRHELSVRTPGGTPAYDPVERPPSPTAREADRILILIHGYENSEEEARTSYERFQASLRRVAGTRMRDIGTIWEFHWPGDHPFRILSVATYSNKIGVARACGEALARQWLAQRKPWQTVCIVAHSLGCRVAVEAVRTIRQMATEPYGYWGARIEAVILMAAAVPVALCESPQFFLCPFDERSREYAFYSRRDRVLGKPFSLGQLLANAPRVAVGRDGDPGGRWTDTRDTSLGHGRYWASDYVAQWVCEWFGLPGWRTLDARLLPSDDLSDDARSLEERRLQERPLEAQPL
jgi:hypothetical protein